jgi:nickel-dependent lactate racemase
MKTPRRKSYRIPYDDKLIEIKIPETNVRYYHNPESREAKNTNQEMLQSALARSTGGKLAELVRGKYLAIVIEDATRTVPLDELLAVIVPQLSTTAKIIVLMATGTHDGENSENYAIVEKVKTFIRRSHLPLEKVVIHNCHSDPCYLAGATPSIGNRIYVNSAVQAVDMFLVFSDMKNHYFAGYSNALKNFVPGLCAYPTVERNHALALRPESTFGHHPLHPENRRRNNPLAQDIWEAYQLIVKDRPVFVVATITMQHQVIWAGAGWLESVLTEGIRQVDRLMSLELPVADKLIVSCGGYPNDESLYSAQRALELNKNGIHPGGEILFLAGCRNGIGPEKSIQNFYNPLKLPLSTILKNYDQHYIMYAHKTYKFAQLITRMNKIHVLSRLTTHELSDIHLIPCQDAQILVDQWVDQDPATSINIITEGNKYAVYPAAS